MLVEALTLGRHSIGIDVDPVAVEVTRAKTAVLDAADVRASVKALTDDLSLVDRGQAWYAEHSHSDLEDDEFEVEAAEVKEWIPDLPNIDHWFRRYVAIDLARIRRAMATLDSPVPEIDTLLRVVFASILRNASNADPVPVSGLEVTKHMRDKDEAGRVINPFSLVRAALVKASLAVEDLSRHAVRDITANALRGDATTFSLAEPVDAIITSPPYHNAVDYYRRHTLEMYWLGHVESHKERLELLPRYIGRPHIPAKHPLLTVDHTLNSMAAEWEQQILDAGQPARARDFRHYMVAMTMSFDRFAAVLAADAPVVLVVGHSAWNGDQIPTTDLLAECAGANFRLDTTFVYDVKNRYMSYARHNEASIDQEYVVVLRRRAT